MSLLSLCFAFFVADTPLDSEYSHLPDLRTLDGVLDLLSACSLIILGNVLDFRTYSAPNQGEEEEASAAQRHLMAAYDLNHITANERQALCYARGVALSIFDWVRNTLVITAPDANVVRDLPSKFFIQIVKALMNYKSRAMQMKLKGAPHCDTRSLRRQVINVLKSDVLLEDMWKHSEGISDTTLAFGSKDGYSVAKKAVPHSGLRHSRRSFSHLMNSLN